MKVNNGLDSPTQESASTGEPWQPTTHEPALRRGNHATPKSTPHHTQRTSFELRLLLRLQSTSRRMPRLFCPALSWTASASGPPACIQTQQLSKFEKKRARGTRPRKAAAAHTNLKWSPSGAVCWHGVDGPLASKARESSRLAFDHPPGWENPLLTACRKWQRRLERAKPRGFPHRPRPGVGNSAGFNEVGVCLLPTLPTNEPLQKRQSVFKSAHS